MGEQRWTMLLCACGQIDPMDCSREDCSYFRGEEIEVVPASYARDLEGALRQVDQRLKRYPVEHRDRDEMRDLIRAALEADRPAGEDG